MKDSAEGFWIRLVRSKAFRITISVYLIASPLIKMYIAWRNLPPSDNRIYIAAGLGIAAEGAWYLGMAVVVAVLAAFRRMYFEPRFVEPKISGVEEESSATTATDAILL